MTSILKYIKESIRENRPVIIMIILVGILHLFPHGYLWFKNYPLYTPLTSDNHLSFQSYETTYAYAPWANEIYKGGWIVRDVYSYEYQNLPTPFIGENLPAIIIGSLARLLNSLDLSFVIASAIFPPLAFFLVFKILTRFKVEKLSALVGGLVIVVFWDALIFLPLPSSTFYYFSNFLSWDFLPFNRSFHPQISFVILCLNILGLIYLIEKPTFRKAVVCGILTGSLFYTYIFHWTAYFFSIALYVIYLIYKKDPLTKYLVLVIVVSAIIGLPYFIEVSSFKELPLAAQFNLTNSYAPFHLYPSAIKYVLIIVVLALFGFWQNKTRKPLALLLVTASILPILGQIIFGRDIEGDHWLSRINVPFETLCLWALLFKKKHTKLLLLVFSLTLVLAFSRQVLMSEKSSAAFKVDKSQREMITFMNDKVEAKSVIGTLSFSENTMLAVYTDNKAYVPKSDRSLIPVEENIDRFLLLCKFFNVPEATIDEFFDSSGRNLMKNSDGSGIGHLFALSRLGDDRKAVYSESVRKEINDEYRKVIKSNETIHKYKIDYLLVTPLEKRLANDLDKVLTKQKLVYKNAEYSLYEVTN